MSRFWYNRAWPFVMLADALVALVTLGFWNANLQLGFARWYASYTIKRGR